MSFEKLSPSRRLAVELYNQGLPYKEIAEKTGEPYDLVYAVIYRAIRRGELKPRRIGEAALKRKALDGVLLGQVGNSVRGLDVAQIIKLIGKMKRGETMSDMLVRVALSR